MSIHLPSSNQKKEDILDRVLRCQSDFKRCNAFDLEKKRSEQDARNDSAAACGCVHVAGALYYAMMLTSLWLHAGEVARVADGAGWPLASIVGAGTV